MGCKSHAFISMKRSSFVVDFVPVAPVSEAETPSQRQLHIFYEIKPLINRILDFTDKQFINSALTAWPDKSKSAKKWTFFLPNRWFSYLKTNRTALRNIQDAYFFIYL